MKKLLDTLFNHERYQIISLLIATGLLIWFLGCEPKCKSLIDPTQQVTRAELEIEIDSIISQANIAYASLEKQEELRDFLFQQSLAGLTAGTVNPLALIGSAATILGIGAGADNIRKRKEIKRLTT